MTELMTKMNKTEFDYFYSRKKELTVKKNMFFDRNFKNITQISMFW